MLNKFMISKLQELSFYIAKDFYKAQNRRQFILFTLIATYIILGILGYILAFPDMNFIEKIYRSSTQFAMQSDWDFFKELRTEPDRFTIKQYIGYAFILTSALTAFIAFVSGAFLLFMEGTVILIRNNMIIKGNHIITIGLGENIRSYVDNELKASSNNILIIESNRENQFLHEYKSKGLGVLIADATDEKILNELNLKNSKHIFISAGSDEKNIEIALEIVEILKKGNPKNIKLIISLTPQGKRHYYTNNGLLDIKSEAVDIRVFCFADEAARQLFENHEIDGDGMEIIDSNQPFAMMVIGAGDLAASIIYHAVMISAFPNRNHLTIYCVDDEKKSLKKQIDYLYNGIKNIEKIRLEFLSEYHFSSVKPDYQYFKNIKNIIVCNDDQEANIEIASDLVERVYRHQNNNPKVLTAIYDMTKIALRIDDNNGLHHNIFSFANSYNICKDAIISNKDKNEIAMHMHMEYAGEFNEKSLHKSEKDIVSKWKESAISDKESNFAQAHHISVKLKVLGLKILRHDEDKYDAIDLLEKNRKKIDSIIDQDFGISELFNDIRLYKKLLEISNELESLKIKLCVKKEEKLYEIIDKYFPNDFSNLLIKLVNSEHERWNNYHYLNNWKKGKIKQKNLKIHNCLKPFSDFEKNEKKTLIYDIFSILYLPNYCAQVGWELIDYSRQENNTETKQINKIGVTGHRDIEETDELKKRIETVLSSLELAEECELITALADGTDMFVTDIAMKKLNLKMNVILPYEKEKYIENITKKERFEFLLAQAKEATTCEWIGCAETVKESQKDQYELCGRTIVNKCDVLIALYDGKESRGKGGTAEIVDYARTIGKYVIVIDVERK